MNEIPHGGPDGGAEIRIDFSTNAHPLGPNPWVRDAVQAADRTRYPDPRYTVLREALGRFHGVVPDRVVIGASASELIWRMTHAWKSHGGAAVVTDERTFGEYRRAALGSRVHVAPSRAAATSPALHWVCDPDNPSGESRHEAVTAALAARHAGDVIVIDLAYQPFLALLNGAPETPGSIRAAWADDVVQLWSPNKLHGLTGVRGAYLVLPRVSSPGVDPDGLRALAPSWVLGGDGLSLLESHVTEGAWTFLRDTVPTLRDWKLTLERATTAADWQMLPSDLHYGLYRPPLERARFPAWLDHLRAHGIKVRDATSFGRPGWVRLRALAPDAVAKLIELTARR
jgi:histidinol-phosphate aminotransferase